MQAWQVFEFTNQMVLSPLLADTRQRHLFRRTNACHERMFFDIVTRLIRPSHFFEIGAHEASTAKTLADRLPETLCVAFEADPEVYTHFSKELLSPPKLSNFRYEHSAVSDRDGEIVFHKQISSDVSSKDIVRNNSVRRKSIISEYKELKISSCRLDSYANSLQEIDSAVLWIDVEGLCFEVLSGAVDTLTKCRAIYAEVEDYEIWEGQKTVFSIYPMLEELGFVPVSRDVETPGQYNVLWLKKESTLQRQYRSRLAIYYNELNAIARQGISPF